MRCKPRTRPRGGEQEPAGANPRRRTLRINGSGVKQVSHVARPGRAFGTTIRLRRSTRLGRPGRRNIRCRSGPDQLEGHSPGMESDAVLARTHGRVEGAWVRSRGGRKKAGKPPRPVFFGDEASYLRTFEIDAFEPTHGTALEAEAGRATMGNAIYRDLIQSSLMVDAQFLVLGVPVEYRCKSKGTRCANRATRGRTPSLR